MGFPPNDLARNRPVCIRPAQEADFSVERPGTFGRNSIHGPLPLPLRFNPARPARVDTDQIGAPALGAYFTCFTGDRLMCASAATPSHAREATQLVAREVIIAPLNLAGTLHLPASATALVVFAHGSGSSRLSPRNMAVANALNGQGIATLLFDLLKPDEERDRANVFDCLLYTS